MKTLAYENIIYEYRFSANNTERTAYDHMSSLNLLRSQYDVATEEKKCIITESLLRVGSIFIIGLISYLLVLIF